MKEKRPGSAKERPQNTTDEFTSETHHRAHKYTLNLLPGWQVLYHVNVSAWECARNR